MNDILSAVLSALPTDVWGWIVIAFQVFCTVVAVCAAVVKLVAAVSKITPTTKDDEFAARGEVIVSKVMHALDVMSLGLTAEQARRDKNAGAPK